MTAARAVIAKCIKCDSTTLNIEDEYGEIRCSDCLENAAEAAYGRHCEAYHDGGATQFKTLQQQQIEARRFK